MTTLDQLVEAGARAAWEDNPDSATFGPWDSGFIQQSAEGQSSLADIYRKAQRAAILAILPLLADDLAGVIQRRMDERFAEYGTTESDTNASYYSGRAGELYESLDEEDEEIAQAIRNRLTALENENG